MHKLSCALMLAGAVGLAGCGRTVAPAAAARPFSAVDPLRADLDPAVKPGADFFTYANGGWLARNPIPASESAWGIGNAVQDEIYARLRTLSEHAAADPAAPGSDAQKVGDFWTMAMDEGHADQAGLTPLQPELAKIAAIQTRAEAVEVAGELMPLGVRSFFSPAVTQDDK
ncbi:MAG: hypothetical protein ACRD1L_13140, partial [Terriglobales bacterium]